MPLLDTILGGNIGKLFQDVVGTFKLSPEKKAEFQAAVDANKAALDLKQLELEGKAEDALAAEVQSAAEVIKAEAQSQSWLPRNVRPFLLLLWGVLITVNYFMAVVAQFAHVAYTPVSLPDWVYKLTAIGFTGYVTARTWEKVKDKA